MKAVVAAFNQEKALVGAFSVITNLWMELFEALVATLLRCDQFNFKDKAKTGRALARCPAAQPGHWQIEKQEKHLIN